MTPTTIRTSEQESDPPVPFKPPANNRSILILREIEANSPESSVRDIFNSENCPSKPVHCEYALQNSWYVTFKDDEDARLALAYIRKNIVRWKGKPIMARYKPKPPAPSAANQPPPRHHIVSPIIIQQQQQQQQQRVQGDDGSLVHQHPMTAGYTPYYGQQGQMLQAPWDLSTVFVYNGLSPYDKTSVSSVSLIGAAYQQHHSV